MTALAPRPRTLDAPPDVLLDAAIDGDEQAWQVLCDRHLDGVQAVAHARLRDPHAAEDVVQETLLRAWTRLHQLDDAHRMGAWMKAIAANVAVDHVRRQRITSPLEHARDTPAPLPSHDEIVLAREEADDLHARLADLRAEDRHALWRRDALGVPVGVVARELDMTPGSVRVLLTRARRRVRETYNLVAAPLVGLFERVRSRTAGLGDALPIALAAPVVVVTVVATVVTPSAGAVHTPTPIAAVDAAPAASAGAPDPVARPTTTPAAMPSSSTVAPRATPADTGAPGASEDRYEIEAPVVRGGFREGPPTDKEPDGSTGPRLPLGPLEGLDVYLDETGTGGGIDCLICP